MGEEINLRGREQKVLDHGFVRLVDYMGSDASIVEAARVSYGTGTKRKSEDRALIRYLMRHQHTTPFEMVEFKWHVKLPIFVARQWIRHRTANVNEYSGRYSVMKEEFYVPEPGVIGIQSTLNKQGREETVAPEIADSFTSSLELSNKVSYQEYEKSLESGIARELARINLPLSLYTEWYWKLDLHNIFRFLNLRMDSHAQWEIQQYANALARDVNDVVPVAYEAFSDYILNSVSFSGAEQEVIKRINLGEDPNKVKEELLSKGEIKEFDPKYNKIYGDTK